MKTRPWLLWTLAFLIVAAAAVYQRMTGPTYPVRGIATIGSSEVRYRLLTSSDAPGDQEIRLAAPDPRVQGYIRLRRTPSRDPWRTLPLARQDGFLVAQIPHQPPAGKVMYQVFLESGADPVALTDKPVVLRFKGPVPLYVLIPHVTCMFLAMLFSTACGLKALMKAGNLRKLTLWTLGLLCAGGLILGPIQQKLAFGAFWTGWPFGSDLTDNKTVVAMIFWVGALWRLRKKPDSRGWVLAASALLMLVYMIPHSMLGSEIDYTQAAQGQGLSP
jgi:hypothetical protein